MKQRFFLLCALTALSSGSYFSFISVCEIFDFSRFDRKALAQISRWEVEMVGAEYKIKTFYIFDVPGGVQSGVYVFPSPYHPNEWAAIDSLKELAKSKWTVLYDSKNPSHNSLKKSLPTYNLIRAVISFVLAGYFVFINRRMSIYFKN